MKTLISASVLALIVGLAAAGGAAQKTTRIKFARGAAAATGSGYLTGFGSKKAYVIRVRAGQTLSTRQLGSRHNITLAITDPDGEDVTDSDASCNNRKEVSPTLAGDYTIVVIECQKADPWRGTFRFRVTVR